MRAIFAGMELTLLLRSRAADAGARAALLGRAIKITTIKTT